MKEVIVTLKADGTVSVATKGVKGKACKALSAPIEKDLNMVDATVELTAEYHQASVGTAATQKAG